MALAFVLANEKKVNYFVTLFIRKYTYIDSGPDTGVDNLHKVEGPGPLGGPGGPGAPNG